MIYTILLRVGKIFIALFDVVFDVDITLLLGEPLDSRPIGSCHQLLGLILVDRDRKLRGRVNYQVQEISPQRRLYATIVIV